MATTITITLPDETAKRLRAHARYMTAWAQLATEFDALYPGAAETWTIETAARALLNDAARDWERQERTQLGLPVVTLDELCAARLEKDRAYFERLRGATE